MRLFIPWWLKYPIKECMLRPIALVEKHYWLEMHDKGLIERITLLVVIA
jgi:hypothetical protein